MCAFPDIAVSSEAAAERTGHRPDPAAAGYALVIEEKPICRLAIAQVLEEAVDLAATRTTGSLIEAAALAADQPPALMLIDLFSINYDFRGLERLLAAAPETPAIMIDDRVNPAFVQIAQDAGARGYISKDFPLTQFRHAIGAVFGGGSYFPARPPRAAGRNRTLSPRQMDVLKQMAVGRRNREIAELLGITPGTVKLHIHAILRLTGARNRTEAALLAGRFLAPNSDA